MSWGGPVCKNSKELNVHDGAVACGRCSNWQDACWRMPADTLCIYLIICDGYGVLGSKSFSATCFQADKKDRKKKGEKGKANKER